jgi:phosphate transport system substrate-binding protein
MKYKVISDRQSIYGTLNTKGSIYVERLLSTWISNFQAFYPQVESKMDFESSTQGIKSLMNADVNLAVTSRKINQKERNNFKRKRGYEPIEIKISLNALAIYVNRQNKINKISIAQLDALFSSSLKRGYSHSIENWKDISNMTDKVHIYLYDINSSTREYFKKNVMRDGVFNSENIYSDKYSSLTELIDEVALDINGICFGSVGNKNHKVKALSLSNKAYFPSYKPSIHNIKTNKYPLTRFFYIYLDIPPDKAIPKVLYEFCKYILSKEGQSIVSNAGQMTLSSKQVAIELARIRR